METTELTFLIDQFYNYKMYYIFVVLKKNSLKKTQFIMFMFYFFNKMLIKNSKKICIKC